ncbi:MAG: polyphosphate kinase 1 [Defluviitaleaceae bacterium]|nr:polyphosphate kinase 1 [Defluviitaleaceae bacterium]
MTFDSEHYINRELSWLAFNERVLEEARDESLPLLERLKFLAIASSNLDEFFMVRVAGLMDKAAAGVTVRDPSGLTAEEQLRLVGEKAQHFVRAQHECLNRSVLPALEQEGISFAKFAELNDTEREFIGRYFSNTIYPILTPMAIDRNRPFPLLKAKALHLIVVTADADKIAVVQVPTVIPRIIPLSGERYIFLEEVIREFIGRLFAGHEVREASVFRILRDADINQLDAEGDLIDGIEESVRRRKWGEPVRLETERGMSPLSNQARRFLCEEFKLDENDVYEIDGALDLTVWMNFAPKGFERLQNPPLTPVAVEAFKDRCPFEVLCERDVLVHHPYESFECVVGFVKAAAADPRVLAIKQTLYRVSGSSPIVEALIEAVANGKQVTALVELMARFDEENNITWAKRLEASGAHVVYGLSGLKTHCKLCLVVRNEDDGIRRYVHLGTGNYNDSTARLYTDLGYFTSKETFGQDISSLFNMLTGYSTSSGFNRISVAPEGLRRMLLRHIEQEEKNARDGKPAGITAKLNALTDTTVIDALYRASQAGARIRLIVRGICCLRSGLPGISENITVVSIIDRFLEHARIFCFENGGSPRVYLSSADWMRRNLDQRVEIAFPLDGESRKRAVEILEIGLADTEKQRVQNSDGTYYRKSNAGEKSVRSQMVLYELLS